MKKNKRDKSENRNTKKHFITTYLTSYSDIDEKPKIEQIEHTLKYLNIA